MTIGPLGTAADGRSVRPMDDAARLLLAQSISLAALIAATLEYAQLVARRAAERRRIADLRLTEESGLRGLVRVTLLNDA